MRPAPLTASHVATSMSSKATSRGGSGKRPRDADSPDEPLTKPPRVPFGVRLPPELIKDVKREAVERDQTVQEFTENALRAALGR
jgi:hypothetical protein